LEASSVYQQTKEREGLAGCFLLLLYFIPAGSMQETTTTAAAAPVMEEEEWYVKVGSRFFRVKQPRDGGAGAMEYCRRLHYLDSCFLCKKTIDRNRDIFMYRYDLTLSCTVININL
jgi:hypothetical protein